MGHPIGKKNLIRTPEEKEKIVLEYLNGKVGDIALTDENWNNFMDGLKENGLDDMISLWQVAMDVYGGNKK